MTIKFLCTDCGHKLRSNPSQAGKHCKCPGCGHIMTIPVGSTTVPASKYRLRRVVLCSTAGGLLLIAAVVLLIFLRGLRYPVERRVNALKTGSPTARADALLWLSQADPQDPDRLQVTAALEPLLFDADACGDLDSDLLLRTYLHWAGQNNVPTMIRLVRDPNLPSWSTPKTAAVMKALARTHDPSAFAILAGKLPDPKLYQEAVSDLELVGPDAQYEVLDYLFDADPQTRQRANQLLEHYGTAHHTIAAAALQMLKAKLPVAQCTAAAWFADNPPNDAAQQAEVATALVQLLDDLSPRVNGESLRALKFWATRDSLPMLSEFAQRQEKASSGKLADANNSQLIDVLAQFPDEASAEAIALFIKDPVQHDKAVQALLKLGPVATGTVLHYLNHPDGDLQKEARSLCRLLKISADRQLEQTLADVGDSHKSRARVALANLAKLRSDDVNRPRVSKALNAPLLDADDGIRAEAVNAARVWATSENSAALVKVLGSIFADGKAHDLHIFDTLADSLIAIGPSVQEGVIPLLKSPDAVVRFEACRVLAEVGTDTSVRPLKDAIQQYGGADPRFFDLTQIALTKIKARS